MSRTIIWYSDGAASTVAGMLTLKNNPSAIPVYTATNSEHTDNVRYRKEVEDKLFHKKVLVLQSKKYKDIWDVFEKTGWLVGPNGARCTTELKKKLRQKFQRVDDVHVFGYTADSRDAKRALKFKRNNFELIVKFPLIDRGLTKSDCLEIVRQQGIEIPEMYKLGYPNNNCIGCVKAGQRYWARIRRTHPDVFERMSKVERKLNVAINKKEIDGERIKVFLDELPEEIDITEPEQSVSCGLFCGQYLDEE